MFNINQSGSVNKWEMEVFAVSVFLYRRSCWDGQQPQRTPAEEIKSAQAKVQRVILACSGRLSGKIDPGSTC